jgi:hypothetical protein
MILQAGSAEAARRADEGDDDAVADDPVSGGAVVPERLHDRLARLKRRLDTFETGAAREVELRVRNEVGQVWRARGRWCTW